MIKRDNPMIKYLLTVSLLIISSKQILSCTCEALPSTFCESTGWRYSEVALVEILNYGADSLDWSFPGVLTPFAQVKVLDDLENKIPTDTIKVYLADGFSCAASVYFPIGDTALYDLQVFRRDSVSTDYELSGCGLHYLRYMNDTLFNPLILGVDEISYEDFVDQFEDCKQTVASISISGQAEFVKTGELLKGYDFYLGEIAIRTDSMGKYQHRITFTQLDTFYNGVFNKKKDSLYEVTTIDLIKVSQHIRKIDEFSHSWQYFAADVDKSGEISILDIIYLQRIILGIEPNLADWVPWIIIRTDNNISIYENYDPLGESANLYEDEQFFRVGEYGAYRREMNLQVIKSGDII